MGKPRRHFSNEIKRQAVEDYVSGRKTVAELSVELGVAQGVIYRWKVCLDENTRDGRISDLELQGLDPAAARLIRKLEEEVAEYQKKVGEQAMIIDLLKKLRNLAYSQRESELSGLIATMKPSGRRKGRAK